MRPLARIASSAVVLIEVQRRRGCTGWDESEVLLLSAVGERAPEREGRERRQRESGSSRSGTA